MGIGLYVTHEVALYRIAAEALHNVARHARATGCALALEVGATAVELRVSDAGAGRPDTAKVSGSPRCASARRSWAEV
jgi:signal transduction histidine kinase